MSDRNLWDAYIQAGQADLERGQLASAEEAFRAALARAEGLGADRLALTLGRLATVFTYQGRLEQALDLWQRAVGLLAAGPELGVAVGNLGAVLEACGRLPEAEGRYRESVQILQPRRDEAAYRQSLENLAGFSLRQGRLDQALGLWEELTQLYAGEDRARALHTLSHIYDSLHRPDEADTSRKRALELLEPLWGSDSLALADLLANMADSLSAHRRPEPASVLYTRSFEIFRSQVGLGHPKTQSVRASLLRSRSDAGDLEGARRLALEWEAQSQEPEERARLLNELGMLDFVQGRHERAAERFEQALVLWGAQSEAAGLSCRYNLASALHAAGRSEAALARYREALEQAPADHPLRERITLNLASLLQEQGQAEEAAALMAACRGEGS